jgi:hypothetical protein
MLRKQRLILSVDSGPTSPAAPSGLVVTPGGTENTLDWTDNSGNEDAFAIFRSTDGVSFSELTTVSANVTTYDDTGLTNGQIYYYYVKGRKTVGGDSSASNTANGTPVSSLMTNLVHYWKLDEASGNRAATVGGITLTDTNTVGSAAGLSGTAADFESSNSEALVLSASQVLNFGNAWSVQTWHKTESGNGCIWQAGDNLASPSNSAFKLESNYLYGSQNASAVFKHYNAIPNTAATWYHTVITWNGTTLKVYQNGADITAGLGKPTDNAGTMADVSRLFQLGCANNAGYSTFYDGLLQHVAIWARALSAGDVTALYGGGMIVSHPFPDVP